MTRRPARQALPRPRGTVSLERALSKLGVASRADARRLILEGRVRVDGRLIDDPRVPTRPEQASIELDGVATAHAGWRLVALHKPRGHVTTRRDPQGRPTVFDLLDETGGRLVAVGRLDLATSGLLLFTSDTRLADWLTDPAHAVVRVYVATVRGWVGDADVARLEGGIEVDEGTPGRGRNVLAAHSARLLKRSRRESHLEVRLREGRNREVRRLFDAIGHEVTRLRRVAFGGLELGRLPPGAWRAVSAEEAARAFPGAPIRLRPSSPSGRAHATGTQSARRRAPEPP